MTNYYNILGLEKDADIREIKASYRKLSKKFHPDLNPDDEFFNKMFLQIQEAYEVLSNEESRKNYNAKLSANHNPTDFGKYQQPINDNLPIIDNFSIDKQEISEKEEFTVTWNVRNADFVQIRPLGVFKEEGYDKFVFNKLKVKSINLVLIATNTNTGVSVRRHLVILNKDWKTSNFLNDRVYDVTILILRVLIILVILMFFFMLVKFGVTVEDPNMHKP